jgi:hypothetical protein
MKCAHSLQVCEKRTHKRVLNNQQVILRKKQLFFESKKSLSLKKIILCEDYGIHLIFITPELN